MAALATASFLLLFAHVASAAPSNRSCDLPSSLQRQIAKKYPGTAVVRLRELTKDDVRFFKHDHGNACPGLARADFFGDGKPALAILLLNQAKKELQFIIARHVRTEWTIQTMYTGEGQDLGPMPVVWSQPPGKYTDIEKGKVLRAAHSVFVFCGYEGFAIVYAWTGKKIDKVWVMD